MSSATGPILIAGAGIGGLTLALGLARRGVHCRILERRAELSEAGAGIQLGPNAMHVLARLGLADQLKAVGGQPSTIVVHDGASGRRLGSLPLGAALARRYGAPYVVCHRADLQEVLAAAVASEPAISLLTGFAVGRIEPQAGCVRVTAEDGRSETGRALVGADGLWSTVRSAVAGTEPMAYAGKLAARAIVPAALCEGEFRAPVTGVWLSDKCHVVLYPIRAGREVAIVVILDEPVSRDGWGSEIGPAEVMQRLAGFSSRLLDCVDLAPVWRCWSLYDPPALETWSKGNLVLIGDAAHPVLPFLAQGGAMAIEDAETLAILLSQTPTEPEAAFRSFEELRRPRVLQVQKASRENGRIYHLSGLSALARNAALMVAPGDLLMARYAWLYGWNGDLDAASAGPRDVAIPAPANR